MIAQNHFPLDEILLERVIISEKSSAYQEWSIVDTDITNIVEPALSLSSAQLSKQNSTSVLSCQNSQFFNWILSKMWVSSKIKK